MQNMMKQKTLNQLADYFTADIRRWYEFKCMVNKKINQPTNGDWSTNNLSRTKNRMVH